MAILCSYCCASMDADTIVENGSYVAGQCCTLTCAADAIESLAYTDAVADDELDAVPTVLLLAHAAAAIASTYPQASGADRDGLLLAYGIGYGGAQERSGI